MAAQPPFRAGDLESKNRGGGAATPIVAKTN